MNNSKQVGPYGANDYRASMGYSLMAKLPPDIDAWFAVAKANVLSQMGAHASVVGMLTVDIRLPREVLEDERMRLAMVDRASEEISYQARAKRLMVVTVPRAWFWVTKNDFVAQDFSGRVASVTVPQWAP